MSLLIPKTKILLSVASLSCDITYQGKAAKNFHTGLAVMHVRV